MKFHEDILNGFQVRQRNRFCNGRTAMAKTMSLHPEGENKTPNKVMCYRMFSSAIAIYSFFINIVLGKLSLHDHLQ